MKRLRLVRPDADHRVQHVTHQVVVHARHPVRSVRRWWPLLLVILGVCIVVAFMAVQQVRSDRRGQSVAALAEAVETQNTVLASAGLPTVADPSALVSDPSDLPSTTTVTVTTTPNGQPTGAPAPSRPGVVPPVPVTYTTTVNGVPVTVTTTLPAAPATVTSTTTAPGTTSTSTSTVTSTVTTTAPAPPPVTVTETVTVPGPEVTVAVPGPETTVTSTVTVTADPPPDPEPNPEETP